jgi:cyclopropane fatty-acyl-phospholipid synthase-like methyltransferase
MTRRAALLALAASCSACCPHPAQTAVAPAAPSHTNRDLHGPPDVAQYIRDLEKPDREVVEKASAIVSALHVRGDESAADLGCGPGIISIALAKALSQGVVFAIDVEPGQLDRLNEHVRESALDDRVVPVLAVHDDPRLPRRSIDLLFIVDAYHHLDDRPRYLARLKTALKDGARVAVVDWQKREQPKGPPPSHTLARETVLEEMQAAGFKLLEEPTFLQYQYFLIFGL